MKQFRVDMAQVMLSKQSIAVDDISGATVSCRNWKLAAARALDQAETK